MNLKRTIKVIFQFICPIKSSWYRIFLTPCSDRKKIRKTSLEKKAMKDVLVINYGSKSLKITHKIDMFNSEKYTCKDKNLYMIIETRLFWIQTLGKILKNGERDTCTKRKLGKNLAQFNESCHEYITVDNIFFVSFKKWQWHKLVAINKNPCWGQSDNTIDHMAEMTVRISQQHVQPFNTQTAHLNWPVKSLNEQ